MITDKNNIYIHYSPFADIPNHILIVKVYIKKIKNKNS